MYKSLLHVSQYLKSSLVILMILMTVIRQLKQQGNMT